ncbi:hypothetical protein [Mycobacteroides abscessus]|uniref:hypothetical protein n=1 Tax=Mycobacteroides abscessus TaxID=36809 RepID=UPI00147472DE
MAIWICDQCQFSRNGHSYRRYVDREFEGETVPHLEICCQPCWDAFLALDPDWDWEYEGWRPDNSAA